MGVIQNALLSNVNTISNAITAGKALADEKHEKKVQDSYRKFARETYGNMLADAAQNDPTRYTQLMKPELQSRMQQRLQQYLDTAEMQRNAMNAAIEKAGKFTKEGRALERLGQHQKQANKDALEADLQRMGRVGRPKGGKK